jgi:hypothetical protein
MKNKLLWLVLVLLSGQSLWAAKKNKPSAAPQVDDSFQNPCKNVSDNYKFKDGKSPCEALCKWLHPAHPTRSEEKLAIVQGKGGNFCWIDSQGQVFNPGRMHDTLGKKEYSFVPVQSCPSLTVSPVRDDTGADLPSFKVEGIAKNNLFGADMSNSGNGAATLTGEGASQQPPVMMFRVVPESETNSFGVVLSGVQLGDMFSDKALVQGRCFQLFKARSLPPTVEQVPGQIQQAAGGGSETPPGEIAPVQAGVVESADRIGTKSGGPQTQQGGTPSLPTKASDTAGSTAN